MALDIFSEKGTPLDRQRFTWRELVQTPISKLDDDAFTRVRIILMNGIEAESVRFQRAFARMSRDLARTAGPGPPGRAAPADHGQLAAAPGPVGA